MAEQAGAQAGSKAIDPAMAFSRGTDLEVTAVTARGSRAFNSTVRYMDMDNMWIVPPKDDRAEGVVVGADITVVAEKSGSRYTSKVRLKEITTKPELLWRVDRPKAIERGKGRAVVRQDVRLADCTLLVEHEGREDIEGLEFMVNVIDLSTGGAQFESMVEIVQGPGLIHTLRLPLPHMDESLDVRVALLDSRKIRSPTKEAIVYRVRFDKPPSRVATEITRHLYELQLDSRSAGESPRAKIEEEPIPAEQGIRAIRIGAKVTLECYMPRGNVESYFTTIQDIKDTSFFVMAPLYRGAPVPIDAAKEIVLIAVNERSNALVVARTKRLGVIREPLLMWILALPTTYFTRHQRSHVRLKANILAKLHISDPNADPPINSEHEVILVDLSAGGAAFQVPARLPVSADATHEITFELEGSRTPFDIRVGLVGDIQDRKMLDRTVYVYKTKFLSISERRQDEVTRYIFNEQLKQRRRGIV